MRRLWYGRKSLVLTVLLCFSTSLVSPFSPASFAQSNQCAKCSPNVSYRQAREDVAIFFRYLKKKRESFPRAALDEEKLAEVLGKDIEDIFSFVRGQISYEPYAGVLRLAQGTLMSLAGNSYDQSMLLAALLRAQGYTARYARGTLTDDQARRLIEHTGKFVLLEEPALPLESIDPYTKEVLGEELIEKVLSFQDAVYTIFEAELLLGLDADYKLLVERLKKGKSFSLGDRKKIDAALLENVKDHCWVQVESGGTWIDLDPSFPGTETGMRVSDPVNTSETLSAKEKAYKLKFAVFIEQEKGGDTQTKQVLDSTVPLTETINEIRYMTMPEVSGGVLEAFSDKNILNSSYALWPLLWVNGVSITGTPFDTSGDTIAEDPRMRMAENTRKSMEGGFDALGGALSGIFEEEETAKPKKAHLTRAWIEISLIDPAGTKRTAVRQLARRPKTTEVDDEAAEWALRRQFLSSFEMLATGSRIPESYVELKEIENQIANRQTFFVGLAHQYGKELPNTKEIINSKIQQYPFQILKFLAFRSQIMDENTAERFPGLMSFPAEPHVVSFRRSLLLNEEGDPSFREQFDILFNGVQAMDVSSHSTATTMAFKLRLQQGILDTLLEYLLLGGADTVNTHSVLTEAVEQRVPLILIKSDNQTALSKIHVDQQIKDALGRDLEQGFVVLVPKKPVVFNDKPTLAWWRIDPETGETLGISQTGQGASMTEYIIETGMSAALNGAVCALFQVFVTWDRPEDYSWGDVALCAVASMVGGAAGAYFQVGKSTLRLVGLNAALCAITVAIQHAGAEIGGAGIKAPTMPGQNETAGQHAWRGAKDVASCIAISTAIGFAGKGLQGAGRRARNAMRGKSQAVQQAEREAARRAADAARRRQWTQRIRQINESAPGRPRSTPGRTGSRPTRPDPGKLPSGRPRPDSHGSTARPPSRPATPSSQGGSSSGTSRPSSGSAQPSSGSTSGAAPASSGGSTPSARPSPASSGTPSSGGSGTAKPSAPATQPPSPSPSGPANPGTLQGALDRAKNATQEALETSQGAAQRTGQLAGGSGGGKASPGTTPQQALDNATQSAAEVQRLTDAIANRLAIP